MRTRYGSLLAVTVVAFCVPAPAFATETSEPVVLAVNAACVDDEVLMGIGLTNQSGVSIEIVDIKTVPPTGIEGGLDVGVIVKDGVTVTARGPIPPKTATVSVKVGYSPVVPLPEPSRITLDPEVPGPQPPAEQPRDAAAVPPVFYVTQTTSVEDCVEPDPEPSQTVPSPPPSASPSAQPSVSPTSARPTTTPPAPEPSETDDSDTGGVGNNDDLPRTGPAGLALVSGAALLITAGFLALFFARRRRAQFQA